MILRKIKHWVFYIGCFVSISLCLGFLAFFMLGLLSSGSQVLTTYKIKLPIQTSGKVRNLVNYNAILDLEANIKSSNEHWVPVSKDLASYLLSRKSSQEIFINKETTVLVNNLLESKLIDQKFNWNFFTHSDSSDPQMAGIKQALYGSIFTVLLCIAISLPAGVITSIYVNFLLKKNFLYRILKTNLANLASVPSIVYGIVGLFLFINILHVPRSSILSGALTLSLLAIPIIIVVTDRAISTLNNAVIDGAYAMGASKMHVILSHVLPMSAPSIITGTILAAARVLGETAPLIMIGMVAFITAPPQNILSPSTTLPVQIYIWAGNPETNFTQKASLAIIVLLLILAIFNILVNIIKRKYTLSK